MSGSNCPSLMEVVGRNFGHVHRVLQILQVAEIEHNNVWEKCQETNDALYTVTLKSDKRYPWLYGIISLNGAVVDNLKLLYFLREIL